MNITLSIITGLLLGFVTSAMRSDDSREDLLRNVFLGMGGAYVGTFLARALFDSASTGELNFALVATSVLAASIVLFVSNRARRT